MVADKFLAAARPAQQVFSSAANDAQWRADLMGKTRCQVTYRCQAFRVAQISFQLQLLLLLFQEFGITPIELFRHGVELSSQRGNFVPTFDLDALLPTTAADLANALHQLIDGQGDTAAYDDQNEDRQKNDQCRAGSDDSLTSRFDVADQLRSLTR